MQEERVESGGEFEAGPSAFIAENPVINAFRNDLIAESSYVPWTTPAARFVREHRPGVTPSTTLSMRGPGSPGPLSLCATMLVRLGNRPPPRRPPLAVAT